MPQSRKSDEDSDMAISYANRLPAGNSQTLPSFRELLPPHLHDEIESTSYYTSPRQSQDRPGSGHEMTADPRSILGHGGNAPPAEAAFRDTNREYSVARTGENQPRPRGERSHLPVPMGDSTAIASHFASRGQSPILPPIRDLQSMSERGVNAPNNTFPESRAPPRSDPFGTQDYRASHPPTLSGPMADPRNLTNSGPPMMHAQALPYGHPQMGYQGDPEQISPQMMTHPQQANFGVMGDSIDPKTKRRRGNLPKPVTDILRAWFLEHVDHPYPSEEEKQMFMTRTGLSINQISNWFINARRRQLPQLRNQMRSGGAEVDSQRQSPFSDVDQASESLPSPHP